ncbi:MAG TPA: hypothetical protein VGJ51_17350 [Candidatus Angelobacter sp.]
MEQKFAREETIRDYLLGTLSEPELSKIEQELFFNEELSRTAGLIEDEIIKQYLDQELDPRERKAVEAHFLRPPDHRQKLDFARLLRHRLESSAASDRSVASESQAPLPPSHGNFSALVRSYGALAAAGVLGALSLYLGVALQEARFQIRSLTSLAARNDSQTSPLALNIQYGVTRGHSQLPQIAVPPTARTIKVDLLLPRRFAESFDVHLLDRTHDQEQEIWSKKNVPPAPSQPRLTFEMPIQGIRTGTYDVVVSDPVNGRSVTYPFDAVVSQSP